MKKLLSILSGILLLTALLPVPIASAATSPACGAYPQLNAYRDNNYVGLLGVQCPQFTTAGFDVNWGDTVDAFRGSDNNSMNSFKIWNPTSQVWCLVFYDGTTINSPYLFYEIEPLGSAWVGPLGGHVGTFADKTSRVEFYTRASSGGTCP